MLPTLTASHRRPSPSIEVPRLLREIDELDRRIDELERRVRRRPTLRAHARRLAAAAARWVRAKHLDSELVRLALTVA